MLDDHDFCSGEDLDHPLQAGERAAGPEQRRRFGDHLPLHRRRPARVEDQTEEGCQPRQGGLGRNPGIKQAVAVAGNPHVNASQAVLGVGYRVGGAIGDPRRQALASDKPAAGDDFENFDDFAHRFTVSVVAALNAPQLGCVRRLLELHKPAHTDFTLCTADSGIRAGLGAHVGISSVIGKSAGFEPGVLGDAVLGTGTLLGRPELDREGT